MNKLVISCVDGGPGGDAAARVGSSLARRLCSPLMLATVAPAAPQVPGRFDLPPSCLRQARSTPLRQARSIFGQAADGLGPDPELRIEFGEPAERLTSLSQREHAGLLVVGVPDRPAAARRLLGSVYLALAGTSPCPVVVVPPSVEELPRTAGPIVCGVDGSDGSLAAAGVAVELARRLEARAELVHVTDRPPLDRDYATRLVASHDAAMRVLLRTANLPQAAFDLRVELGRPAQRLADVAAREEAPLIVNGSQGSGFDRSALLGSVSSELALTATQPLVLVPLLASAGRLDHAHKRAEQARRLGRLATQRRGSGRPPGIRPATGRGVSRR